MCGWSNYLKWLFPLAAFVRRWCIQAIGAAPELVGLSTVSTVLTVSRQIASAGRFLRLMRCTHNVYAIQATSLFNAFDRLIVACDDLLIRFTYKFNFYMGIQFKFFAFSTRTSGRDFMPGSFHGRPDSVVSISLDQSKTNSKRTQKRSRWLRPSETTSRSAGRCWVISGKSLQLLADEWRIFKL